MTQWSNNKIFESNSFQSIYPVLLNDIANGQEVYGKQMFISPLIIHLESPVQWMVNIPKYWKWAFIEGINRLSYLDSEINIELEKHRNPGCAYPFRSKWNKKLETEGGTFDYSYGEAYKNQIPEILKILKSRSAKEALMTVWSSDHLLNRKIYQRKPCTLTIHFVPRGKVLDCHVNMRTSDVVNLLPFDIFHHTLILRYVASELNYEMGSFWFYASTGYFQKKRYETGNVFRVIDTINQSHHLEISEDWKFGKKELIECIKLLEEIYFRETDVNDILNLNIENKNLSEFGKNYLKALLPTPPISSMKEFDLINISR